MVAAGHAGPDMGGLAPPVPPAAPTPGQRHSYSALHLIIRCGSARLAPMAAYVIDVRQKILRPYERRLGFQHTVADVFGVSRSCIEKLRSAIHHAASRRVWTTGN
jgi:hypothetical protein